MTSKTALTSKKKEEENKSESEAISSGSDSDTDSEDELARSRIPDDDPRWQKVTYDNGVKKIILQKGWGKPAPDGSDAYIRYIGKFKDSQRIFEDNTNLNPPFKFLVGHFRVIRAIDIAVAAMKIGEKCLLRTTSRYAFGEKGEGRKIAPNKDLDYELEVIDWNDWKRVNNKDEVKKRLLKQGEGDMYDVPDASAICDITYTAQVFSSDPPFKMDKDYIWEEDEKYPSTVFSCGRHIEFMVDEDPTFPKGFHEALKCMNKYEISEFKIEGKSDFSYSENGNTELGIAPNQTLYYRIQMHNYQNLMSRWKMEPRQLFDVGNRFKLKAKQYFALGNWNYAFNRYEKALEYFEADEKMDHEEKQEAGGYITMVHNNMAMIHLKRYEFLDCIRECNKVLAVEKENVKAWCRKGQSRMMLADYKKANQDLKHALNLDSNNKFIKRLIKTNRSKKKSYTNNQKKLYGGMFDRYNEHLKAKELAKVQGDGGKIVKSLRNLNDIEINYGDIDDYDNDENESEMSIDFDFDDMDDDGSDSSSDDDDDSGDNSSDDDNDNDSGDKNKKDNNINALEAINEDD